MNRSVLLLLLLGFVYAGCNRENAIEISGIVTDADKSTVYFEEINLSSTEKIDSVKLRNSGKFSFKTESAFPRFFQLRNENGKKIMLVGQPGDKIMVTTSADKFESDYQVEGSMETKKVQVLNAKLAGSRAKYDSITNSYKNIQHQDTADIWFSKHYLALQKEHKRFVISMLLSDPTSLSNVVGLYHTIGGEYVFNSHLDLQYFKIARDSLTKYYPRTRQVISLQADANRLLDQYNRYRIMNSAKAVEMVVPDIKLPNMQNDTVSLSSLKGKYVLLNFWASPDRNSIAWNIQLKGLYNDYKKAGFEVYNVSLDNSNEAWKRAVRFDQLPWINVNDTSGFVSKAAVYYNVRLPLPVSYLLDTSQENILGKNLSEKELRIKLDNLLN